MLKLTSNARILEKTESFKDRALSLSRFPVLKTAEGKRFCLWCGTVELTKSNQKYCSTECSLAIWTWAQPQKENGLFALLTRQEWKCKLCDFDYFPFYAQICSWMKSHRYKLPELGKDDAYHMMKRFKRLMPSTQKPEVDHIVPIYKGGQSLGLDNHQAICYSCHKTKTKVDLSGKRKKNADDQKC